MGAAIAKICSYEISTITLVLALFTTLLLQILSNFANDYGDGIKGSDHYREKNDRMVQSGNISKMQMKKGIVFMSITALIFGLTLIFYSFSFKEFYRILTFLVIGILAIIAAIKYTVGKSAYGYVGLGDLFVFLFFGVVGVSGSFFLFTHDFNILIIPGSFYVGTLSCAVLNLNNMRDMENDIKSNKRTFVVLLGSKNSKIYHYCLILIAFISLTYILFSTKNYLFYISAIPFLIIIMNIAVVYKNKDRQKLDGELKKIALSCFFSCLSLLIIGLTT